MTVSPLDSLSQDLVLHILDSRDADDPGGYSMLQLQEVTRLGACSRALRRSSAWARHRRRTAAPAGWRRRSTLSRMDGGAPPSSSLCGDGGVLAAAARLAAAALDTSEWPPRRPLARPLAARRRAATAAVAARLPPSSVVAPSWQALDRAMAKADAYATIAIACDLDVPDELYALVLGPKPLRLVGADGVVMPTLRMRNAGVYAVGDLVCLENLRVHSGDAVSRRTASWHRPPRGEWCETCGEYHTDPEYDVLDHTDLAGIEDPDHFPAVEVGPGSRLLVYDCEVDAENGTALLVDEQAGAAAVDCRLSSSGQYLGVVAKSQATVALHGCEIGKNRWGVALGLHDEVYNSQLAESNDFYGNADGDVDATLYPHYRAQVLYPWTQLRIKAEAEAAEASARRPRAAAERRDAEGERTGERPRKRSRLPISPVRGG